MKCLISFLGLALLLSGGVARGSITVGALDWQTSSVNMAPFINSMLQRFGEVRLTRNVIHIQEPIVIPEGGSLLGTGFGTELRATGDFAAIQFEDGGYGTVKRLRITRGDTAESASNGILVVGSDILVERVWIEDCFNAVVLPTSDELPHERVTLRGVRARHTNPSATTSQYGLLANSVVGLLVDDCHWSDAWLDGIKLRRRCLDVTIRGGSSSENGRSLGSGASGDGIDCFAGGGSVVIDGTVFESNGGNGIVIKTIGEQGGESFNPGDGGDERYGRVRQFRIANTMCRDNAGAGMHVEGVYNSDSDEVPILGDTGADTRGRANLITVTGGIFAGNGTHGLLVNGLNVVVSGSFFRANGAEGLRVAENARDVSITSCQVLGCSASSAGALPGVTIEGGAKRVKLFDVRLDGLDRGNSVDLVDDATEVGLTKNHRNGIEVHGTADEIEILDCRSRNATADAYDRPVVSFQSGGSLFVRHSGAVSNPQGQFFFGGPGSIIRSTSTGSVWVKTSGLGYTGWEEQ